MRKFLIVMLNIAVIFFNAATCSAEDWKFIDSNGDIGYFIDMDTVKIQNANVFTVNLIVVRLNSNQMEVTDTEIDHAAKKYVIRSTKTLSYDDRTELNSDNRRRPARSYSDKSLFNDIVQIVIYGGE